MSAAERLAAILPAEAIDRLEHLLLRVNHAGTTRLELHHDQEGRITDVEITAPTLRVRVKPVRALTARRTL